MICPICNSDPCTGVSYPHMIEQYLAGRDVEHWRRIHDRLLPSTEAPADPDPATAALRAHIERHGCCG